MPRVTIDDFRARLSGGDASPLAALYREITRRPELRRPASAVAGWAEWPQARATPAA